MVSEKESQAQSGASGTAGPPHELDRLDAFHVWHPFTQMQEYLSNPRLQIERGKGCWVWDLDGNRYLDANASIWTNVHGHCDPDLDGALADQLAKIAHSTYLGLGHAPGTRLAAKLAEISPGELNRVFFSDNGSNAVEIALKLSFQYWQLTGQPQRKRVIALTDAYHGDTFGTMSVGDSGIFHQRFSPWFFPVDRIPAPRVNPDGQAGSLESSLEAFDRLLASSPEEFAALLVEPWIQGAAGMQLMDRRFLSEAERRCKKHGIHLIFDEVFVGFGRCGPLLVCQEEAITPDFLCLAKGLTAGYIPMAATLTTEKIYQAFLGEFGEYKAFFHGHTFTGNPLAAAVALRSIEKIEAMQTSGQIDQTLDDFDAFFDRLRRKLPSNFGLRHRGLAGAIDLPSGDSEQRRGMHFCIALRQRGVLLRALGDSLLIVPPLIISAEEIAFLESALIETFEQLGYLN